MSTKRSLPLKPPSSSVTSSRDQSSPSSQSASSSATVAVAATANSVVSHQLRSSKTTSASSTSSSVAVRQQSQTNEVPGQNSTTANTPTATPTSSDSTENISLDLTLNENQNKSHSLCGDQQRHIKKRPISISTDSDAELICPICFDLIDVAHVTKCGHSFCLSCIQTALDHTHRCPKCNTPCSFVKDIFPNFTLNQIIERFKEETNFKKCKLTQSKSNNIVDYIHSTQDDLNIEDVNELLSILTHKREQLKYTNKKVSELLLHDFLKHLQQVKTEELNRIQHELEMVNEDFKKVKDNLANIEKTMPSQNEQQSSTDISISLADSSQVQASTSSSSSTVASVAAASPATNENKIQSIIASKKRIVHRYFDELSQTYVQAHNRDLNMKDFNIKECTKKSSSSSIVLDQIRSTVSKITQCSEFRCIASVNYNSDLYSLSSIVSSVDFDRSYEHFALAGVTKRIKIFDFASILERPYGIHYPQYEMTHNAKLSCVSWNRYFRQQLVCSDYEGVVTLWDSEQGSLLRSYQEHEKRCWGVEFCNVDPRLIASASDDSKVKIWSTNSEYSLLSIDAKSNVCCVVFKPDSKFHVLFGTADHSIHYYDLRNPKEAISLFKGHRKAVSYVKFCNETSDEFVSASTDSHLKMWKLNEGQCIRSFTGHLNEKNFVGLETHNGYIVTGSENNTCYLYCNELSKPILNYKFDDGSTNSYPKQKDDASMNDFVSAVCWSNQNHLLAANSQGVVKVLELI